MGHPTIENKTPFAFEALFLADEELRPLVVPVIKGTFAIVPDAPCERADEQIPITMGGEYWDDDPATSSYKYEPEVAFFKPATDIVLIGQAYAPRTGTREMTVELSVGPVSKTAVVIGDRVWRRTGKLVAPTRPTAFESIPLLYENAFGGWDRRDPNPDKHAYEPRNPVGVGFYLTYADDLPLPNIEDPRARLLRFEEKPPPAGFGFVPPQWQPRAALAGTYDQQWQEKRAPLLPTDFDRKHLNAASADLVAPGYLQGDEAVHIKGATAQGMLSFSLPRMPPPKVRLVIDNEADVELVTHLDTVIIEPDEQRLQILWRTNKLLRTGPHDLRALEVTLATL